MNCACQYDEYEIRTELCRPCAMNLEQGSEEWRRARLGKLTASRISDALAKNRQGTGPGITQLNYQAELICERLNGFVYEGFQNSYMERGKEEEDLAVKAYDLFAVRLNLEIRAIGFVQHRSIPYFGASPDRAVGNTGLLEAKNRKTNIHFDLLRGLKVPTGDVDQVLTELACAEWAEWCDYISYDSRAPVGMDLFVKRFYRDDHKQRINEIEQRGQEFLAEVERQTKILQERSVSGFIFLEREIQDGRLTKQLEDSVELAKKPNVVHARKGKVIQLVK
jgi:YqaJ-like recombinase protein